MAIWFFFIAALGSQRPARWVMEQSKARSAMHSEKHSSVRPELESLGSKLRWEFPTPVRPEVEPLGSKLRWEFQTPVRPELESLESKLRWEFRTRVRPELNSHVRRIERSELRPQLRSKARLPR